MFLPRMSGAGGSRKSIWGFGEGFIFANSQFCFLLKGKQILVKRFKVSKWNAAQGLSELSYVRSLINEIAFQFRKKKRKYFS